MRAQQVVGKIHCPRETRTLPQDNLQPEPIGSPSLICHQ
jgi:hypothetical protein